MVCFLISNTIKGNRNAVFRVKAFFRDYVIWISGYELYWYELMWETLSSHKILNAKMKESKQESFLLAIALVDLYREFAQHAQDEHWYEAQELNIANLEGWDYDKICQLLNIPAPMIHDFYSKEEILIEGWDEEDIQRVLFREYYWKKEQVLKSFTLSMELKNIGREFYLLS